jgi:putative DNA primase/helicase
VTGTPSPGGRRPRRSDSSRRGVDGLPLHDNYLIDRFAADHGDVVRHCAGEDCWLLWDGKRWGRDHTRGVESLARETLERVALDLEDAAARCTGKESATLMQRAKSIRSPRYVQITLNGAAGTGVALSGDRLGIAACALDDPALTAHLLNCSNGVLNLKTLELTPHERAKSLLITRLCDIAYTKGAACKEFPAALGRIFEADCDELRAKQLIAALQQSLGYSLSGEQTIHAIFVLLGKSGHNGKSFLIKIIQNVLGREYTTTLHRSVLLRARGEQHPTGVMELRGRRIAFTSEFADRQEFDGALLKSISGDDQISGRHMKQDFQTFVPTHHLWIASNHLPAADKSDMAVWNRLVIFPFERTFIRREDPDYSKVPEFLREDPTLAQRIIANEREGVLAWMVEGLRQVQRSGRIEIPEVMLRLRGEMRQRRDSVEQWLAECCDVYDGDAEARLDSGPKWASVTADLRNSYWDWCEQRGLDAISGKALGQRLALLGFPEKSVGDSRGRAGLRLRGGRQ